MKDIFFYNYDIDKNTYSNERPNGHDHIQIQKFDGNSIGIIAIFGSLNNLNDTFKKYTPFSYQYIEGN